MDYFFRKKTNFASWLKMTLHIRERILLRGQQSLSKSVFRTWLKLHPWELPTTDKASTSPQVKETLWHCKRKNHRSLVFWLSSLPQLLDGIEYTEEDNQIFSPSVALSAPKLYQVIPQLKVKANPKIAVLGEFKGPSLGIDKYSLNQPPCDAYKDVVCGRSISTYPISSSKSRREGDPICDRYSPLSKLCGEIARQQLLCQGISCESGRWIGRWVYAIWRTKLCWQYSGNWGIRPFHASRKASAGIVQFMCDHQSE